MLRKVPETRRPIRRADGADHARPMMPPRTLALYKVSTLARAVGCKEILLEPARRRQQDWRAPRVGLSSFLHRLSADQLPHLLTFSKAAETGSFTAAARALRLTQAAVSQRIQALEKMLNVVLFERHGGRVHLSEAGHRLYDYAQRILALEHEAVQAITGRKAPVTGELILAASSVPGEHLLPDLLSVFRKRYPHIQVKASVAEPGPVPAA